MPGRKRQTSTVLWVLWMTYGSFYFCRTNISAALPGIQAAFGFTKADLGWVLAALKIAYAAGQLINGQLSERVSPRLLLAIGMFASAILNLLFGFGTAVYFWLFVWACNGYAQALGWTPTMRVAANWFEAEGRGVRFGIIGTSYQVTAALTFVISGLSVEWLGWRGAFWIPAALLAASGVHTLLLLREAPEGGPLRSSEHPDERSGASPRPSWRHTIRLTLGNPALWLLALALGLLNATRYGFLDWGLSHVLEVQRGGVGSAALKYAVLPLGGVAGAYLTGWVTDKHLGGRRAPAICTLLVLLGILTVTYGRVVHVGTLAVVITLALVGFAIYGAQVLLVGTFPVDLARPGTAAASVGFVNCMGYVGASASDVFTGWLVQGRGWNVAVLCWAGYAFAAAAAVGLLWNAAARTDKPATR